MRIVYLLRNAEENDKAKLSAKYGHLTRKRATKNRKNTNRREGKTQIEKHK